MNYDQNYIFNCGVFIYMAYMCLVTHFYAVVVIALTFTIVWLTKLNYKSLFLKKGSQSQEPLVRVRAVVQTLLF